LTTRKPYKYHCDGPTRDGLNWPWLWNFYKWEQSRVIALKSAVLKLLLYAKPKIIQCSQLEKSNLPQKPYAAFHIRHGDKQESHQHTHPSVYVNILNRIMTKKSIFLRSIYVASDDPTIRKQLLKELKDQNMNLTLFFSPGVDRADFLARNPSISYAERERRILNGQCKLFCDMKYLVEAELFVGTQKSNLGMTVYWLRDAHECYNAHHPSGRWDPRKNKLS